MSKEKTVKIVPAYNCQEDVQNVWGVQFVKQEDGTHVGEVSEELAKEMVDNGRATLAAASKAAPASKTEVKFADEAAEAKNKELVKAKNLTAAEFKKIDGTGEDGAITVGDLEDYVASKAPKTPPAPAAVK